MTLKGIRFHVVKLSESHWEIGRKTDRWNRYFWIDIWRRRFCVIADR